jgi:hypothetical protein
MRAVRHFSKRVVVLIDRDPSTPSVESDDDAEGNT